MLVWQFLVILRLSVCFKQILIIGKSEFTC